MNPHDSARLVGRLIGRYLPRPVVTALLRLVERYAPGVYAEAVRRVEAR